MILKGMRHMYYELYVDSLFLVNFTMNLYLLMLVDQRMLAAARPWRLILGAVCGALAYPVLFLLWLPVPVKLLLGVAVSLGMLPVTFSIRGFRSFLKLTESMLCHAFCMGGVLLLFLRCFRIAEGVLAGVFGIMAAGGCVFLFRRHSQRQSRETVCRATLKQGGAQMTVAALIDSGNSLCEPISGKPVCVVERAVLHSLWKTPQGYRAIPYHSIGRKHGILEGYPLQELSVEAGGVRRVFHDVYVAAGPEEISSGDFPETETVKMILNPRIFTEKGIKDARKRAECEEQ